MGLSRETCVPCRGGVPALTRAEAEPYLQQTPGWMLSEDAVWIERTFPFKDFAHALRFVNAVGGIAEQEGHHPDVTFGWGYAKVVLYTHKIHGLHQNDFILAAKLNELA